MATHTYTAVEAVQCVTNQLVIANDERIQDLQTILRESAGHMPLPHGGVFTGPAGLVAERREIWHTLIDTIRIDSVGVDQDYDPDATWRPVHAGAWESVLATLVVEGAWDRIHQTAQELRAQSGGRP